MLSDFLPGAGGLKNTETAKGSLGVGVKTRLKPVLTPAWSPAPSGDDEHSASQGSSGSGDEQEYTGGCDFD